MIRSIRKQQRRQEARKGTAMVEMAVCFPIFMLMLLGIIEFGRGLMVSQLLTNAAREGCRESIRDDVSEATVAADVRTMVSQTVGCDTSVVGVLFQSTSRTTNQTLSSINDAAQRDLIQVTVSVPFDSVSFMAGRFLSGSNLSGTCAMRKQ